MNYPTVFKDHAVLEAGGGWVSQWLLLSTCKRGISNIRKTV